MTSNKFYPYNFPHAKLTHKNDLNEYYFYDAAFTEKLSGESAEASFIRNMNPTNLSFYDNSAVARVSSP
jgi:hypothetical protein